MLISTSMFISTILCRKRHLSFPAFFLGQHSPYKSRSTGYEKNLLIGEQIAYLKNWSPLRWEAKIKKWQSCLPSHRHLVLWWRKRPSLWVFENNSAIIFLFLHKIIYQYCDHSLEPSLQDHSNEGGNNMLSWRNMKIISVTTYMGLLMGTALQEVWVYISQNNLLWKCNKLLYEWEWIQILYTSINW